MVLRAFRLVSIRMEHAQSDVRSLRWLPMILSPCKYFSLFFSLLAFSHTNKIPRHNFNNSACPRFKIRYAQMCNIIASHRLRSKTHSLQAFDTSAGWRISTSITQHTINKFHIQRNSFFIGLAGILLLSDFIMVVWWVSKGAIRFRVADQLASSNHHTLHLHPQALVLDWSRQWTLEPIFQIGKKCMATRRDINHLALP